MTLLDLLPSLRHFAESAVGAGHVVVDSDADIAFLSDRITPQQVLLGVVPDVDAYGHRMPTAGVSDQKLGFPLAGDQATAAVGRVLNQPMLKLVGLQCHIGPEVTDCALYGEAIRRMIAAMADIRAQYGLILGELNVVAGHTVDPAELADFIDDALDAACAAERFPRPRVVVGDRLH